MAEYIKRDDAIKAIEWTWAEKATFEALKNLPAADVRPVILCKDCKYWELSKIEPSYHVCTYLCGVTFVRNQDDFCSRGEKREES